MSVLFVSNMQHGRRSCNTITITFTLYSRSVWFLSLKLLLRYNYGWLSKKYWISRVIVPILTILPHWKGKKPGQNVQLGQCTGSARKGPKKSNESAARLVQWFTTKPSKSLSVIAFSILSTKWRFSSVSCSKNDIANIVLKLKQLKFQGLQLERTQWVS